MLWNEEALRRKFSSMGADLRFAPLTGRAASKGAYTVDVRETDGRSTERFILSLSSQAAVEVEVLHAREAARHLLLLVKTLTPRGPEKHRYLCGHDERHWFVAAVPDLQPAATTVEQAMEALQPVEVREALRLGGVRPKDRRARRNPVFVRQGEWFFLPAPDAQIDPRMIHRHEPLRRGGKPHTVEELVRWGGETMYVCRRYSNGLTVENYERLLVQQPEARSWGWRVMQANPTVFARGKVTHPDHATVELRLWHRVLLNQEGKASWARQVVFLD